MSSKPNALEAAMQRALAERSADAAWSHLEPFRASLTRDPEVASAWSVLLQASPSRPGAVEDLTAILEHFGAGDPALAAAAITALVRVDERRPLDEPAIGEGAASVAAKHAERLLATLPPEAAADADRGGALTIAYANALRRLGPARDADAAAAFERAIARHGARGEWLVDLGLCHKWAGRFRAALLAFRKAREKLGDRRPVLFHLAGAAIGAGEGEEAAAALRALGHAAEAAPERLPFVPDLAPAQLRVPTRGPGHGLAAFVPDAAASFERVWVQPLSPLHGVVRSPTFREAIADWGDVVLWDAAPTGTIPHEGRAVPVFPMLAVLKPGDERRFRFLALEQTEEQVRALGEQLPEGVVLYVHGQRVEQVCARCAAGEVLTKHEHEAPTEHRAVFGKLLIPGDRPLPEVRDALEKALRAAPGVLMAIPALYEALGLTQLAGKNHKSWGVIERGTLLSARAGG
ncbi:hypothetical protein [Sandaracinus amylolyticus]|uniref:Tetratricopeptide repeat protein n=1 Tax=Sandaracinus amylolyticus TaxID=927083 RepID=A0A0F6YIL6_9BACT|nr:hypothetical protein [Sandaracinus amylolyticus]AKF06835.1 hypothetical protein DB32_003984 [Sandaracinus amylolyticus]